MGSGRFAIFTLPVYPPTTVGAELCVHPLHCSKTSEGERFLVGWSVHAHFSHS